MMAELVKYCMVLCWESKVLWVFYVDPKIKEGESLMQ